MRRYQLGVLTKSDLKAHLIWIPKYRKKVLLGPVAARARDVLRQIAMEHELDIISGKAASDHIHVFLAYRPAQEISKIMQWLKGISSRILLAEFPHLKKKTGVKVIVGATVKDVSYERLGSNTVTYSIGEKTNRLSVEKIILTVGRKPDFSLLNIDKVGIKQERGAIVVNEFMETSVAGIYAAGDVVGGIMLAHLASAESECAIKNIMGRREAMNYKAVPSCIYTSPEVGCVGIAEENARQQGEIKVGRFPLRGNGKALVLNETEGMVKIISDKKYGEILGVHIIGPHATDMIAEAVLGMSMEMTAEELAGAIHPHPTLSEAVMEAAMIISGGAIHIPDAERI